MNAKKTDLKELEGWYEKSGNQLMLLYQQRTVSGYPEERTADQRILCGEKVFLLSVQTAFRTGTDAENGRRNSKCFSDEAEQVFL